MVPWYKRLYNLQPRVWASPSSDFRSHLMRLTPDAISSSTLSCCLSCFSPFVLQVWPFQNSVHTKVGVVFLMSDPAPSFRTCSGASQSLDIAQFLVTARFYEIAFKNIQSKSQKAAVRKSIWDPGNHCSMAAATSVVPVVGVKWCLHLNHRLFLSRTLFNNIESTSNAESIIIILSLILCE